MLVNVAQLGGNYGAKVGETERVNAEVRMKIKNEEASHLGLPLPMGVVRVYKADSDGDAIFVGEDHIKHTPKNEELDLMLGRAFDVTARGKQVDYKRIADNVYENSYEIEVKNAKTEPVTVTLREFVPGDWKMLRGIGEAREGRFLDRRMAAPGPRRRQRQADLQGADHVLEFDS